MTSPWLDLYDDDVAQHSEIEHESALDMFLAAVQRAPQRPIVKYFDATLTVQELDVQSSALAAVLADLGVGRGDRVALFMQNVPQFVVSVVATWKLGATVVPANSMYRERELAAVLSDSASSVVICLESGYPVVEKAIAGLGVRHVITTSELDYQTRNDPRIFSASTRLRVDGVPDLLEMINANHGRTPEPVQLSGDDIAFLPYTSGTTGPPKGSINTHRNVVFTAQIYRDWVHVGEEDVVFGVAPLFHITGLIGHISVSLIVPAPLVLTYRFDPLVSAEAIAEHGATFIIGAITVFIAWTNNPEVRPELLASLRSVYSGGAPIPAAALESYRAKFGHYIHNGYGLTESTSPAIVVPFSREAPVDPDSGAVAIGVPVSDTAARIVGDDGAELAPMQAGEIVLAGPQIAQGYWNKPEETAGAMPGGQFHTGDVGFMDDAGWFYIVDRKKDQINASGFKVWPREVEDVLYEHPAVREAAVVGADDGYRGETVKAFVAVKPGVQVSADELRSFCKQRMAAYKYPRIIEFLDELPKTVSGKILRRELR